MAAQVALKRKQAAEDAIALGLRAVAGQRPATMQLPQGPLWPFEQFRLHFGKNVKVFSNYKFQ